MSPKRDEKKVVKRRALEAAADERAVVRAAIAASTIQLRLLHGLVPAVSNIKLLEDLLGMLKNGDDFGETYADNVPGFLAVMEVIARDAAAQIHLQANELGFPIVDEVERFRELNAGMGTLTQMRQALASLDATDWDSWPDNFQTKGDEDE
jgi:hypothetical protein